ncbi:NnrU family protein [uncultured Croceicoccus sp.]|uniref:NnrU family protein n=1 Tax=uncultured Croceicoccus sp. TaxID=1295329 RepID=UPI0026340C97|nr:NnrU family protein [uncultured Croceicoccus sp.]
MTDISLLLSAAIVFVGTHILLSGPLRPLVAGWLGERGFAIAYSLIALVTLGWMVRAFRHAPAAPMLWDGWHIASWLAGSVLTLLALVFLLGSVVRNPALPHPEAEAVAQAREATGIFAVTRHPMMWGIALWAAAHIVVAPNPRTLVLAGALGFLALAGSALQDGRKARHMGKTWAAWRARTTFWPRLSRLGSVRWPFWAGAAVLWLAITWAHGPIGGIPAGLWRWL